MRKKAISNNTLGDYLKTNFSEKEVFIEFLVAEFKLVSGIPDGDVKETVRTQLSFPEGLKCSVELLCK